MQAHEINPLEHRSGRFGVDELFLKRWSPRAMSGDSIEKEELMRLFEAARWAPSSYNSQPWRFVYATRDSEQWDDFFDLLVEFNQSWCKNAAVLVAICSRKTFEKNDKPAPTHSLDTGAAWMSLALQGTISGLVVHGMQGIDYNRAPAVLKLPDEYEVQAMCAIGKPGRTEDLPEAAREKEQISGRKELEQIAFAGVFKGD